MIELNLVREGLEQLLLNLNNIVNENDLWHIIKATHAVLEGEMR